MKITEDEYNIACSMEPVSMIDATSHTNSEWPDEQQSDKWNGEGLPPVGEVCLITTNVFDNNIIKCECIPSYFGTDVVVFMIGDDEYACKLSEAKFEPIRTPEQKAADEREKFVVMASKLFIDATEGLGSGESMWSTEGYYAIYDWLKETDQLKAKE